MFLGIMYLNKNIIVDLFILFIVNSYNALNTSGVLVERNTIRFSVFCCCFLVSEFLKI